MIWCFTPYHEEGGVEPWLNAALDISTHETKNTVIATTTRLFTGSRQCMNVRKRGKKNSKQIAQQKDTRIDGLNREFTGTCRHVFDTMATWTVYVDRMLILLESM